MDERHELLCPDCQHLRLPYGQFLGIRLLRRGKSQQLQL
ncbi:hypothetical protein [Acutalibacter sp. JLR.KK004]